MPNNESKTPITNAKAFRVESCAGFVCFANDMEELELKLSTLTEANRILKEEITKLTVLWHDATEENKKLKEELAANEIRRGNAARGYIEARQQIDQLKSQLAALQAANENLFKIKQSAVVENVELKKKNKELQADKEMLDWLALGHSLLALSQAHIRKSNPMFEVTSQNGEFQDENIRFAITAAMKGTK